MPSAEASSLYAIPQLLLRRQAGALAALTGRRPGAIALPHQVGCEDGCMGEREKSLPPLTAHAFDWFQTSMCMVHACAAVVLGVGVHRDSIGARARSYSYDEHAERLRGGKLLTLVPACI